MSDGIIESALAALADDARHGATAMARADGAAALGAMLATVLRTATDRGVDVRAVVRRGLLQHAAERNAWSALEAAIDQLGEAAPGAEDTDLRLRAVAALSGRGRLAPDTLQREEPEAPGPGMVRCVVSGAWFRPRSAHDRLHPQVRALYDAADWG